MRLIPLKLYQKTAGSGLKKRTKISLNLIIIIIIRKNILPINILSFTSQKTSNNHKKLDVSDLC